MQLSSRADASRRSRLAIFLAVMGPGLVAMLADTDAGSVVTAAQSGARWGYHLLLLQLVLVPILYLVQELTVRLGVATQKGHGELIRDVFGPSWAWLSVSTLMLACVGALVTEFSGIAGVGLLFGVSPWLTVPVFVVLLLAVVYTGSYRRVELAAILMGLGEFAFLGVAVAAHPDPGLITSDMLHFPLSNPRYMFLLAANIGAVIMPWMIFYQQSAVVDKGLTAEHLRSARVDTALGAVLTQLVMAAVLVGTAATIGTANPRAPLNTVQQIADAITPFLGIGVGRMVFSLGMLGASLVAAIVVSLTAAWGLGEVAGYRRSLAHRPLEAPWFYGVFTASLLLGAAVVLSGVNLVNLSVAVEVMNALLLPLVLGFLFQLARRALPPPYRLSGAYGWTVGAVIVLTTAMGLFAGLAGILG
ncbi:MAG: divalent metal cation transporter [Thermaerobacter sp.]|nr:divalent metal cation transporter [Thermaerobacter sp.]